MIRQPVFAWQFYPDTFEALAHVIVRDDISMCGFAPTYLMMTAVKELGASSAELVEYRTSGDASGDYEAVVGYAGIIIK